MAGDYFYIMMRNVVCATQVLFLILFSFFVVSRTVAQSVTVTGVVKDQSGKLVQNANVLLWKYPDSFLVKGVLSDTEGAYYFEDIGKGQYYLIASFAGMGEAVSKMFEVNGDTDQIDPGILILKEGGRQLEAVKVIAHKPVFERLFPAFYASKKLDGSSILNFSYSRRITRPTFNDLAPFTVFFDPKTFYSGNPVLQPAIANTV
jgi:hypothetical protein